ETASGSCGWCSRRTTPGRQTGHPLEAEILDRIGVDQFQRAEALAAHISRITGPLIRQRLHDLGRIEPAGLNTRLRLSIQKRGSNEQRCNNHEVFHSAPYPCVSVFVRGPLLYLIVHKYAVRSCIFLFSGSSSSRIIFLCASFGSFTS